MKLTRKLLAIAIMVTLGAALCIQAAAQNPDAIDNARSIAKSLQQKQENDSNAALDAAGVQSSAKPSAGAPAPSVKPAMIPGASQAAVTSVSAKPSATAKPSSAKNSTPAASNRLQKVNVVEGADGVQIEILSSQSVTPKVSKLSSPARVLVELPETVSASQQNHISVGNAGVKGVRIGTDGKTPPTTSVVVDLEKACTYDLTPSAEGKLVLTLHTEAAAVAKSSPASSTKVPAAAEKPAVAAKTAAPVKTQSPMAAKNASLPATKAPVAKAVAAVAVAKAVAPQKQAKGSASKSAVTNVQTAKTAAPAPSKEEPTAEAIATPAPAPAPASPSKAEEKKPEDKKWAMNGKRDPFFSPVVQQSGSGCSTGKKCLEIGNINLRGVVKSDDGFIAVVTNNLNKAYFLRENDPVFNGYVVKITGDSVVFQETVEDKLGKTSTREVVKRIFTPAV